MSALTRKDLLSLEDYSVQRKAFREMVMAHKKARQVNLGENARLLFEDRLTIQYQIQEMLRIERIFESAGIEEELAAYNPLIPDGDNWKATFMIEFPDAAERKQRLAGLIGIEDHVWVRVGDGDKVYAIADEDMERSNEEKTSSVHFLRFQLIDEMVAAAKSGADIGFGIDHPNYTFSVAAVPTATRTSLATDLIE